MNRRIKKIRPEFWLVLILVFALSLRLYFFVGLASADPQDDGIYMSNIHGILKGSYSLSRYNNLPEDYLANPAETFSFRIGFLYPCVFFSILLGVTEFSITLWPLLCSLGMIVIGFYLGKMIFNENVGLISAFLISFFPLNVLYSTRIAVDIPLAFFSILSFYFFVRAAFYEKNKRDIIYFFLSGISLGLGYLTKSMAIILFLFYFAYFLYSSYKNKKLEKSLIYVFLGFLIIFSIEGMYYYLETGNFLLHKDITTGAYLFKYKIEGASEINLVNGIKISYTDGFPLYYSKIILNLFHHRPDVNYFGFFYYFVIFSILYCLIKKDKKSYILVALVAILFVYLEFGSAYVDFNFGNPFMINYLMLFKRPRFLTILTIPSLIVLSNFLSKTKKKISILIILFLFLTSVYYINESRSYFINGIYDIKEASVFLKNQPKKDIYIDYLGRGMLQYYFGFKRDEYIKDINSIKDVNKIRDAFVIVGGSRGSDIHWTVIENLIPKFIENPPKNWKVIKIIENKKKNSDPFRDLVIYYVS